MSLSGLEIASVLRDLNLQGARVDRVDQPRVDHLVMTLHRGGGRRCVLLIALTPQATRIHTIERRPTNARNPPAFQMLLRKHIEGARLSTIEQAAGDRIVQFTMDVGDKHFCLVAELTSTPKLVLLDGTGRILGGMGTHIVAGDRYQHPAPTGATGTTNRFEVNSDSGVRAHYEHTDFELQKQTLVKALRQQLKKLTKTLAAVKQDRLRAQEASTFQKFGDVLKGALHAIPKGAAEAILPDWSTGEEVAVRVPLEANKTPQQNMERYFRLHRKYQDAHAKIERRSRELEEKHARVETLLGQAERAQSLNELPVSADLPGERAPASPLQGKKGRDVVERLPYTSFTSHAGLEIRVGRSAADNDALTLRHTRGNDLWLHVRGYPGSHVVIRLPAGKTADRDTLLDAATLALANSRAPKGDAHEVLYTAAKNVRKAPKSKPGLVTVTGEKTLLVRLDPARLERLKQKD